MKKELQIKDLRIGNLFVDAKNRLCSVEEISKDIEDCITTHPITPIPLTEEWLLSFGVKALRKGVFDFVKVEDSIGFHVYFIGRHLKEIQYVHELQNLYFALTGEELELKSDNP